LHEGLGGNSEPLVVRHRLPASEDQSSVGLGRSPQIGKGRHWVVEEHHSETTGDQIELLFSEVTDLGVLLDEADIAQRPLPRPLTREGEHRRRKVHAGNTARRAHPGGQVEAQ